MDTVRIRVKQKAASKYFIKIIPIYFFTTVFHNIHQNI